MSLILLYRLFLVIRTLRGIALVICLKSLNYKLTRQCSFLQFVSGLECGWNLEKCNTKAKTMQRQAKLKSDISLKLVK